MLDSADTVFKKRNLVIKETKPSDIRNEINLSNVNCGEHSKWKLFLLPRVYIMNIFSWN